MTKSKARATAKANKSATAGGARNWTDREKQANTLAKSFDDEALRTHSRETQRLDIEKKRVDNQELAIALKSENASYNKSKQETEQLKLQYKIEKLRTEQLKLQYKIEKLRTEQLKLQYKIEKLRTEQLKIGQSKGKSSKSKKTKKESSLSGSISSSTSLSSSTSGTSGKTTPSRSTSRVSDGALLTDSPSLDDGTLDNQAESTAWL